MCNLKNKIINASMMYIAKSGFTQTTLNRGVEMLNLSSAAH